MSIVGGSPTAWAVTLAVVFVMSTRPQPRPRRPGTAWASDEACCRRDDVGWGRLKRPHQRTPDEALALAHWCEAVARSVRSGSSLVFALDEVPVHEHGGIAPSSREVIETVRLALRRGVSPARPIASPDVALVAGVLIACAEHGGPAAEPLDRAASVLRGRAAEMAERTAQSAQARLSARVMTMLPLLLLTVLVTTSPAVRTASTTPPGAAAIVAGLVLNAAGWRWQRRLVDRASR